GGAFSGTGVAGSVFTPSVAGVGPKAITYTVSNAGCQSVVTRTILVNECAERHLTLEQYPAVIVYPIPSNGAFNIRLNTDLYTKLDIKLFNSMGQLVQSQVATGLTYGSIIPVQTFNLPNGTYQLFLTNDEKGGVSRKGQSIIIQKL
ncbi:MAG: T9SS type A sorting domain-containing protein, partial [Chitinophagaceae bacterium]